MKLLIDARPLTDIASGGVARLSRHLVSAYAQVFPDDELILATTGSVKPDLPETLQRPNVRHLHLSVPNKLWSASSAAGAVSFTKEFEKRAGKVDATFLPNLGFVGTLKKPTSLLLHDLSFLIEPRWFNWKQRAWHRAVRATKLIKNVDQLFAVSKRTKQDAIDILGIPEERITVIPIGPTLSFLFRNLITDHPRSIRSCARMERQTKERANRGTCRRDSSPRSRAHRSQHHHRWTRRDSTERRRTLCSFRKCLRFSLPLLV
jgi:glycosyltransferase involved in cell wall biosynthesis